MIAGDHLVKVIYCPIFAQRAFSTLARLWYLYRLGGSANGGVKTPPPPPRAKDERKCKMNGGFVIRLAALNTTFVRRFSIVRNTRGREEMV